MDFDEKEISSSSKKKREIVLTTHIAFFPTIQSYAMMT
jgi:hypothetical protein